MNWRLRRVNRRWRSSAANQARLGTHTPARPAWQPTVPRSAAPGPPSHPAEGAVAGDSAGELVTGSYLGPPQVSGHGHWGAGSGAVLASAQLALPAATLAGGCGMRGAGVRRQGGAQAGA